MINLIKNKFKNKTKELINFKIRAEHEKCYNRNDFKSITDIKSKRKIQRGNERIGIYCGVSTTGNNA